MKEIYHLLNSYINYFIKSSAAILLLLACFIEKTHLVPCPGLCLFYTAITPVCNCSDSVLIRNTAPPPPRPGELTCYSSKCTWLYGISLFKIILCKTT